MENRLKRRAFLNSNAAAQQGINIGSASGTIDDGIMNKFWRDFNGQDNNISPDLVVPDDLKNNPKFQKPTPNNRLSVPGLIDDVEAISERSHAKESSAHSDSEGHSAKRKMKKKPTIEIFSVNDG